MGASRRWKSSEFAAKLLDLVGGRLFLYVLDYFFLGGGGFGLEWYTGVSIDQKSTPNSLL